MSGAPMRPFSGFVCHSGKTRNGGFGAVEWRNFSFTAGMVKLWPVGRARWPFLSFLEHRDGH